MTTPIIRHTSDQTMTNEFVTLINEPGEFPPYEVIRYDQFVRKLFKEDTFNEQAHHAKGGCCEEAGELSDAIKRHITYKKPLDSIDKDGQTIRTKIIEELGDLKFYMQAVCNLYSISQQEILNHNAMKLAERYKKLTYSDAAAQERADKDRSGDANESHGTERRS